MCFAVAASAAVMAASAAIGLPIEGGDRYPVGATICCGNAMCIICVGKVVSLNARIHGVDLTMCATVGNSGPNADAKPNREIILRQQVSGPLWALWNHASPNRVTVPQVQASLEDIHGKSVTVNDDQLQH